MMDSTIYYRLKIMMMHENNLDNSMDNHNSLLSLNMNEELDSSNNLYEILLA